MHLYQLSIDTSPCVNCPERQPGLPACYLPQLYSAVDIGICNIDDDRNKQTGVTDEHHESG